MLTDTQISVVKFASASQLLQCPGFTQNSTIYMLRLPHNLQEQVSKAIEDLRQWQKLPYMISGISHLQERRGLWSSAKM
jgi:hypothetical protein